MRKKLVLYCKIPNKWNCKREKYAKHRQAYGCYNFVHHFSNTSNLKNSGFIDETHLKLHRGSVSPYEKC